MRVICTKSFQFRGTVKKGTTIDITDEEYSRPFIRAHVTPLDEGAGTPPRKAPDFTNALPVPDRNAGIHAPTAGEASTVAEIQKELTALGVHWTTRMTKAELLALLASAKEAVAGTPEEANRPNDPNIPASIKTK